MNSRRKLAMIGVDVVEASRLEKLLTKSKAHQLKKFFSKAEIAYCRFFKDPAIHFAGHFAAKEAASKALGTKNFPFVELEIRHDKHGAPEVWHKRKKLPVKISISHTKTIAIAVALS